MWVRRVYSKDRQDEDAYNFAIKYSDNNPAYPIYVRTYTILRSEYVPLASGSRDPVFASAYLISEEVVRFKGDAENDALDSLYLKVLRVFETLPGPLVKRYETNEAGQTVEVTSQRKLFGPNYVPPTASAVLSFASEVAEENVITDNVRKLPEVFDGKVFSTEVPDPAPVKFRVAVPAITEEETVKGEAERPALATGELSKSEQQVTKFIKRKQKTSRSTLGLPKTLSQTLTTREKQKATVTETLQVGNTSESPSATVDIESEALGDGTFVVRKTQVPKVFNAKSEVVTKPDVLPERFTAKIPTITRTETKEGFDVDPKLDTDTYRSEQERVSEFEIRSSDVTRNDSLTPQLQGRELEEAYNVQVPYTERISSSPFATGSSEVEPLSADKYLIRTYDPNQLSTVLGAFEVSFPTRISLDLPRVLKKLDVKWGKKQSFSDFNNINAMVGSFTSLTQGDTGSLAVSGTLTPEFSLEYEDVWGSNLSATQQIFFLKEPTKDKILSKLGCKDWPVFKPQGAVITATSKTLTKKVQAAVSRYFVGGDSGAGGTYSQNDTISEENDDSPVILNIPPCLHQSLAINEKESISLEKDFVLKYPAVPTSLGTFPAFEVKRKLSLKLDNQVVDTLQATIPTKLPTSGKFLTDCRVEFFKYGWYVVQATVFDAAELA
jgi:hypothetical protein